LTTPGWRINEQSVQEKVAELNRLGEQIELEKATILLQLYDNSVYLVGGAGGTKYLPSRSADGIYHVPGELLVADKTGIKDLSNKLVPLIRALCGAKKLFLSPLSRYWLNPCCPNPEHVTNYNTPGYLPRLGMATSALKDFVRDTLYTRHVSNFRVLCPNKILGIGQRRTDMPMEEARELAHTWGNDPVHPSSAAYMRIVDGIVQDLKNPEARYTNPPKGSTPQAKKQRLDLSLERDAWVRGCTTALPRRDSLQHASRGAVRGGSARGATWRGRGGATRGSLSRGGYPGGRLMKNRGRKSY
jgi:hypothetical protein